MRNNCVAMVWQPIDNVTINLQGSKRPGLAAWCTFLTLVTYMASSATKTSTAALLKDGEVIQYPDRYLSS
jgi:hypothetical protein